MSDELDDYTINYRISEIEAAIQRTNPVMEFGEARRKYGRPWIADLNFLLKVISTLRASLEGMQRERDEARSLCNRWIAAALHSAMMTTDAFSPDAPEAFAASRRRALDALADRYHRLADKCDAFRPSTERAERET